MESLLFACLLMLSLAERDWKAANLGFSLKIADSCSSLHYVVLPWLLDLLETERSWFASLPLHGALDQKTRSRVGRWLSFEELAGGKGLGVSREAGSREKMALVEVKKPKPAAPSRKDLLSCPFNSDFSPVFGDQELLGMSVIEIQITLNQ